MRYVRPSIWTVVTLMLTTAVLAQPPRPLRKPGLCPFVPFGHIFVRPVKCSPPCKDDTDCPEKQKCCKTPNGCKICRNPVFPVTKPGKCLKIVTPDPPFPCVAPRHRCRHDGDCPGTEKCCRSWFCGPRVCGPPVPVRKPGLCPFVPFGHIFVRPDKCPPPCKDDTDCPEKQKCCKTPNGCKICRNPVFPVTKPGKCLKIVTPYPPFPCVAPRHRCRHDGDCPGTEMCCRSWFCGPSVCGPPVPVRKPGLCPFVPFPDIFVRPNKCPPPCMDDTDCPEKQKCCKTPNGCKICRNPVFPVTKPGKCLKIVTPYPPFPCVAPRHRCRHDGDCPGTEKCCRSWFCGPRVCGPPVPVRKPGLCPFVPFPDIFVRPDKCPPPCKDDTDCPEKQKCCKTPNGCKLCRNPVFPVKKPGKCLKIVTPYPPFPCVAPRHRCRHDGDCPGTEKCCRSWFCGPRVCGPPVPVRKPGLCPFVLFGHISVRPNKCPPPCKDDTDCPEKQKCCNAPNGCKICRNPVFPVSEARDSLPSPPVPDPYPHVQGRRRLPGERRVLP
ncbi:hypothetical protein LSAT2_005924 [Lamellibrachia satsuma]|nr:hypothetical protein LSAT2_005924 [Lamellibrachia satsuma]